MECMAGSLVVLWFDWRGLPTLGLVSRAKGCHPQDWLHGFRTSWGFNGWTLSMLDALLRPARKLVTSARA